MRAYSGELPFRDAPEAVADAKLRVIEDAPAFEVAQSRGGSVYRRAFRQGAILVPRIFWLVERKSVGRLGSDPSAPLVTSRRSAQEKRPWRAAQSVENRVEAEFLRPALLGESILPYRVFRAFEAVVPMTERGLVLDAEAAANRGYSDLHGWLTQAERIWGLYNKSSRTLADQLDYTRQLSAQFPVAPTRIVYAKAGTLPAACVIRDARAVIDHKLYWMAPAGEDEARYLAAILNSETARARAAQYQSRGQRGARDFDKVMFNLPIPRFDATISLHAALTGAEAEAERLATAVELPEGIRFQQARRFVRTAFAEAGLSQRIDSLVTRLLDAG